MPRVLLFDVDGVIVQGSRFSERLETTYGIPLSTVLPFFQNEFQLCLIGKADLKQELKKVIVGWGWKGTVDELLDFWFDERKQLNHELLNIVKELRSRGIQCVIGTNQEHYRTEYLRDTLGIGAAVDGFHSSATLGYKKPDPAFFSELLRKENLKPEDVALFIDDSPGHIQGAELAGIPGHLFTGIASLTKALRLLNLWD